MVTEWFVMRVSISQELEHAEVGGAEGPLAQACVPQEETLVHPALLALVGL